MKHTDLCYVLSLTVLGLLAWAHWSHAETPGTQRLTMAASAFTGQGQFMGPMKVTGSAAVTQVREQDFAPEAGTGVWRIPFGETLTFAFDLPQGFRDVDATLHELGWLSTPADAQVQVSVNQNRQAIVLRGAREKTLQVHRLERLGDKLKPGLNVITVANNNRSGDLGIQEFVLSYAVALPRASLTGAPTEATLTLLAPPPQQRLVRAGQDVVLAWRAEHFPPGAGVKLQYREGNSSWQVVLCADALPFNAPSGQGEQGRFHWRPPRSAAAMTFGVAYVQKAVTEEEYWLSIMLKRTNAADKPVDYERYLTCFPLGKFADLARLRMQGGSGRWRISGHACTAGVWWVAGGPGWWCGRCSPPPWASSGGVQGSQDRRLRKRCTGCR
jgi:hypothetical protein